MFRVELINITGPRILHISWYFLNELQFLTLLIKSFHLTQKQLSVHTHINWSCMSQEQEQFRTYGNSPAVDFKWANLYLQWN
jgi:putative exporter of polyketide antibiotics